MREEVGIGGVVAALSVASDLTRGHPPGEAMRACLLATELARRAGVEGSDRADVYYAALMRFAGCAATSHELAAALGGDDIAVRARGDLVDATRPGEALGLLLSLGSGAERLRVLARAPGVPRLVAEGARADCEVGAEVTRRLRLPEAVRRAVLDGFERFDGRGAPAGRAGAEIAQPARFAAVGFAEPPPRRTFHGDAALDDALAAFGDAADLKTPWLHGHSSGVARLARAAAEALDDVDATLVHRAGLVHDLGRVAVPSGVWERRGRLRADEWELVRLHPYHSGRILARSPVLAPLGAVASRHHERLDGSGYPSGVGAGALDGAARLLAAADVLHALGEPRPHTIHIYDKCQVSTRAGLAMFAMQHGLAGPVV